MWGLWAASGREGGSDFVMRTEEFGFAMWLVPLGWGLIIAFALGLALAFWGKAAPTLERALPFLIPARGCDDPLRARKNEIEGLTALDRSGSVKT